MSISRLACLAHAISVLLLSSCSTAVSTIAPSGVPQTIVSVVPSVTEMLYAFGLEDKIVAVGDYDDFPLEVRTKPRIGGLINPNIERIIELHPDLVITYGSQDVLRRRLQAVGIRMFPFVHGNVEQTLQYMKDLGRAVGAEERAHEIIAEIRESFAEAAAAAPPAKPKVLWIHNRGAGTLGSFYTVGTKAFQHDLIEIAGGRNLFADVQTETLEPTLEEVLARKPDIVIETVPEPARHHDILQRTKDWESIGVAKGKIYVVGENYLLVPGPRLSLAAQRVSQILRGVR